MRKMNKSLEAVHTGNLNKNKGITLVSLVITIILLLILAGITINQLIENGIVDKAKQAKSRAEEARRKRNIKIRRI